MHRDSNGGDIVTRNGGGLGGWDELHPNSRPILEQDDLTDEAIEKAKQDKESQAERERQFRQQRRERTERGTPALPDQEAGEP